MDGTGFGKLQMVQTQVADVACTGAAGELRAEESGAGDDGPKAAATARDWIEARLAGLGISVTFADDFKKPA